MKTFVKIFLLVIALMIFGLLFIQCKSIVPISQTVDRVDSTATSTNTSTVKKDSANYRQEVLLRMLNRAQTTISLTRNQVDSLIELLSTLPRGTTITKTDPKLQARIEIMLDSLGKFHFSAISNERYYTETITENNRYIHELENKLKETTATSTESKTEVREARKTFWEQTKAFFAAGGVWALIVVFSLVVFTLLRKKND